MYRLYVIPGSHACRAAMLMLDHKGVPYEQVKFITGTHSVAARLHGFSAGGQRRDAGGRRTLGLRLGDALGTVPGLAANGQRVSTNHAIARFLDATHPDPPLFPVDAAARGEVEAAESWANDSLQMAARRILGTGMLREPGTLSDLSADGRMGYLLYRPRWARRLIIPPLARQVFRADLRADGELLAELERALDRIDGWIDAGVLNGPQLNVADFMVAPSLALILYRPDVEPLFAGRPALDLVDRLLPEPGARA